MIERYKYLNLIPCTEKEYDIYSNPFFFFKEKKQTQIFHVI